MKMQTLWVVALAGVLGAGVVLSTGCPKKKEAVELERAPKVIKADAKKRRFLNLKQARKLELKDKVRSLAGRSAPAGTLMPPPRAEGMAASQPASMPAIINAPPSKSAKAGGVEKTTTP